MSRINGPQKHALNTRKLKDPQQREAKTCKVAINNRENLT